MLEVFTAGQLVDHLVVTELDAVQVPSHDFAFLGWVNLLQPVTPSRLAEETGLPPTTIRDYARRLVERGAVRKQPNPDDGRSYHLVVTAKGMRVIERGWPAVEAAFARVDGHLERPASKYAVEGLRAARRTQLAQPHRTSVARPSTPPPRDTPPPASQAFASCGRPSLPLPVALPPPPPPPGSRGGGARDRRNARGGARPVVRAADADVVAGAGAGQLRGRCRR